MAHFISSQEKGKKKALAGRSRLLLFAAVAAISVCHLHFRWMVHFSM